MARHRTTTPKHLQPARLDKHKAPRAVAGYKRSSVALLLLRLPGRDTQARSGTGHAKTIRWVLYGGEAFREAKNKNAQPAMADSTERRAQCTGHPPRWLFYAYNPPNQPPARHGFERGRKPKALQPRRFGFLNRQIDAQTQTAPQSAANTPRASYGANQHCGGHRCKQVSA